MEQNSTLTQPSDTLNFKRRDVYQEVTDTIINQLEKGTVPWQKTWTETNTGFQLPKNYATGNNYRGINILLLWCASKDKQYSSNDWASYKQWVSKKEAIRKGEKGNLIVYTDTYEKEVDGELQKIPFLKYSVVFNRCQLASYNPEEKIASSNEKSLVEKIDHAEDFVANTFASIEHVDGMAAYNPTKDKVYMPHASTFIDSDNCSATESYYSVLFHELTHWTGHSTRMDRKIKNKFGNHAYAEEELIAELGAAFLSSELSISTPEKINHAGYIANWLTVLKDNKYFIISAASEASKAVEYMKGLQPLKL
ncbi:MAG: zincin-like metallopeptidase domain-containing protein [Ferruginibacter sp.]